jgi:hypothetical protein
MLISSAFIVALSSASIIIHFREAKYCSVFAKYGSILLEIFDTVNEI